MTISLFCLQPYRQTFSARYPLTENPCARIFLEHLPQTVGAPLDRDAVLCLVSVTIFLQAAHWYILFIFLANSHKVF
jgi:hypothetical protein